MKLYLCLKKQKQKKRKKANEGYANRFNIDNPNIMSYTLLLQAVTILF